MRNTFKYFVILARMRTGSNFLETNINDFANLESLGEAYNPAFIGYPNEDNILGFTLEQRDQSPIEFLKKIKQGENGKLLGFRYFDGHDLRVLDHIIDDPECAKIILRRNPLDCYISLKIAKQTGQWKLTNATKKNDGLAVFNGSEFDAYIDKNTEYYKNLIIKLQTSGQTAFFIDYDTLNDIEIINGLARFLGQDDELKQLSKTLKPQNPKSIIAKVENPHEMELHFANLDPYRIYQAPIFEFQYNINRMNFFASASLPILFQPIASGPTPEVIKWMTAIDPMEETPLENFTKKTLNDWKNNNPNYKSFTVVRHPLERAYRAFCIKILLPVSNSYPRFRNKLQKDFGVRLPQSMSEQNYGVSDLQTAFEGFLEFLKLNIRGQTPLRIDEHWAPQAQTIEKMNHVSLPQFIIKESEMNDWLPSIAQNVGAINSGNLNTSLRETPIPLSKIYKPEWEDSVRQIYPDDFTAFGFSTAM